MAYWLFKSEPETWSFEMHKAKGEAGQQWDGVRNYQARNHMRAMKRGDRGFFYHSGAERQVVGIVEVIAEAHPESTDDSGSWDCVDLKTVAAIGRMAMRPRKKVWVTRCMLIRDRLPAGWRRQLSTLAAGRRRPQPVA